LQRRFEKAIAAGEYAKGEIVVASELADRLQAPVDQVMQILHAAYRKGLVDPVGQEATTFKVLGVVETDFASVFTHTAKSGLKPRSVVRLVQVESASPVVAEKLDLDVGAPVYRYVRTRYAAEQTLANQTNYIPFEICPGLEDDDVSRYSFQRLLEEKYLSVLTNMQEEFRLVQANEQDLDILGLPQGSSILLIERIASSPTSWPVVWANIHIRPDLYQYVAALWPTAAKLLE
jgi:GntR family transcriptional regulator